MKEGQDPGATIARMSAKDRAEAVCEVANPDDLKLRIFQAITAAETEAEARGFSRGLRAAAGVMLLERDVPKFLADHFPDLAAQAGGAAPKEAL